MKKKRYAGFFSFVYSQFFIFIVIPLICTNFMGIISYRLLAKETESRAIESNNKLLNQYSTTVDSLIVNNVKDSLNSILQDVNTQASLNYYLRNPVDDHMVDILEVGKYLDDLKFINPIVYSLGIYYKNSGLLVTTEKIRLKLSASSEYNNGAQESIAYYENLLQAAVSKRPEKIAYVLDKGINMQDDYSISGADVPADVLHIIRIIDGAPSEYGAIVATIDIQALNYMIRDYAPETLDSLMIVDENGVILSHTNPEYIGESVLNLDYVKNAYEAESGTGFTIADAGGAPAVISYQTSGNSSFTYISITPMLSVTTGVQYIMTMLLLSALISLLVGVVMSLFAAKHLSKPIRALTEQCRSISYGDRPDTGNEYSIISGTLRNLTAGMKSKEDEMREIIPLLRANFITWLVTEKPDSDEIKSNMKIMKIKFPFSSFCLAAMKMKSTSGEPSGGFDYEYEKARVCLLFEKEFNTPDCLCILSKREQTIFALLNFECAKDRLAAVCTDILCRNYGDVQICAAFGTQVSDISQIGSSWEIAENGLRYSYLYPEKTILTSEEILDWESSGVSFNRLLTNNFINSLKSANCDKCLADWKLIVRTIRDGRYSFHEVTTVLSSCIAAAEDYLLTKSVKKLSRDFLNSTADLGALSGLVADLIFEEFKNRYRQTGNAVSELCGAAKEYIINNLFDPQLSLNLVAEKLGVSANYLSRVFHSECNITFVEYITNLKLSYSRNLVVNSDLKINEIAERLGYSTAQYFISNFKRQFGVTPNVYRQREKIHRRAEVE